MSTVKRFMKETIKKVEIDEYLQKELERAGYGGMEMMKTPLGTRVTVYAMRPGIVIGRGGETVQQLTKALEEKFNLSNPQISVAEIEAPELNPYVIATRIAAALKRGVHFRRAGFWALSRVMEAGALGAEIIISGKLTTERARYEKFVAGYLPKSGEAASKYVRNAEVHVQLKPGIYGVKVKIVSPEFKPLDRIEVPEAKVEGEAAQEEAES